MLGAVGSDNCLDVTIVGQDNVKAFISLFSNTPIYDPQNSSRFGGFDYRDFCKIVEMIDSGAHLTVKGMNRIIKIQNGMNSTRTKFK